MAVRRGRPVEQVCNRRGPRDMKTTRSDLVSSQKRIKPGIRIWSEASRTVRLPRGCKRWHSLAPGRRYGARWCPLSQYISVHLSLKFTTKLCALFENKWERYIFIKKCVSFVRWSSFIIFDYVLGWIHKRQYNTTADLDGCLWIT